jgi:hypothetical protein
VPSDLQLAGRLISDFLDLVAGGQRRGVFVAHEDEPPRAPAESLELTAHRPRFRVEVDASMLKPASASSASSANSPALIAGARSTRTTLYPQYFG